MTTLFFRFKNYFFKDIGCPSSSRVRGDNAFVFGGRGLRFFIEYFFNTNPFHFFTQQGRERWLIAIKTVCEFLWF